MPAAPIHHTPIDKDGSWDGPATEKAFDKKAADFPKFYAWIDEGESDPDADGTDKEDGWGPHHDVNAEGVPGDCNLKGLEAAMAALNGAHGGNPVIPDADRQAVWDHLAAHYKDAGIDEEDIPELKSADAPNDERSEGKPRRPRSGRARNLELQPRCRRQFTSRMEVRTGVTDPATGSPDFVELTGQVITYELPYEVYDMFGSFTETIHYGACTALLASPDLDAAFLVGHDSRAVPLARTGATACLELTDTPEGLNVRALIDPRMTGANDLILGLQNGTISQMSVGMEVDPAGDVWSGEDDWGLPCVRDIYRIANVFDASAVAFPANPGTSLELMRSRLEAEPTEVTVRTQRLWRLAKEGRQGTISQADSDVLMHLIERLHTAQPEGRAEPTKQDPKVLSAIDTAIAAANAAVTAQAKDPDNNTDPSDKKVMSALQDAVGSLHSAKQAQAKDGTPDAPAEPAESKSSDAGEYQGDPDGTNTSAAGDAPIPDDEDGTGSRSRSIDIDMDLMRLRRRSVAA